MESRVDNRICDNPADPDSRGLMPKSMKSSTIYWNGPEFLRLPEDQWPNVKFTPLDLNQIPETRPKITWPLTFSRHHWHCSIGFHHLEKCNAFYHMFRAQAHRHYNSRLWSDVVNLKTAVITGRCEISTT